MKGVIKILIGLIILVGLIWLTFFGFGSFGVEKLSEWIIWKSIYLTLLGGIAWILVLIGIALIVVGFSEINEK